MEKDLKELFEKERQVNHPRKSNHEAEFIQKLYQELPIKKKAYSFVVKIAASAVFIIGIGITSYILVNHTDLEQSGASENFSLGQLSPDLKEIENYYSSNIKILLENIEKGGENKNIKNRYLDRLSLLQKEYETLISEIKEGGPNTFIISALINNLQLQMELLQELNQEIISSKNKHHETI